MLKIKYSKEGNIEAVCEWLLFDENRMLRSDGDILFIVNLVMNKEVERTGVIKYFAKIFLSDEQWTEIAFSRKIKYPERECRRYKRQRIEKLMRGK